MYAQPAKKPWSTLERARELLADGHNVCWPTERGHRQVKMRKCLSLLEQSWCPLISVRKIGPNCIVLCCVGCSRDGKYVSRLTGLKLIGPKGVCSGGRKQIAVVDNKGCAIAIHDSSGRFLHQFGSRGSDETSLSGPHYCTMTSSNGIVVTDFHNHSIKVNNHAFNHVSFSG